MMSAVVRPRTANTLPPEILVKLSRLQGALNSFIDASWTTNRDPDDWGLAITLESSELIDSYPWKWWKNVKAAPNIANVKVELVDILHFSLSGTMQMMHSPKHKEAAQHVGGKENSSSPQRHASNSVEEQLKNWDLSPVIQTPLTEAKNAVATFRNVIGLAKFHKFDLITEHVIASAEDLGFNLVAYYVAKHTLNVIRQLGGYKDGSYKKVNHGKEDNELLHDVIAGVTVEASVGEASHEQTWDQIMHGVYEAFQVPAEHHKKVSDWMSA